MKKVIKKLSLLLIFTLIIGSMTACEKEDTMPDNTASAQEQTNSQNTENSENTQKNPYENISTQPPTEEPTKEPFDVTKAYANKPYTDEFAVQRVEELQYIDDYSLYYLSSSEPSPIFYEGFYKERGKYNVNLQQYDYDMDNETVRQYFDVYEYSKLASAGAVKILDSFACKDKSTDRILYYCYYTITHWSENEKNDTIDYYRDVMTVSIKDKSISAQEKIAIRTALEIPKEISGEHDFHNVI